MTPEENKLFEEALLIEKSANWWINKTSEILGTIEKLEKENFSAERDNELAKLYQNLEVFLARKRIEENKISQILLKIDKIKDKNAKN